VGGGPALPVDSFEEEGEESGGALEDEI
jgi:hypothetical protein